jgi:hypothetical protein
MINTTMSSNYIPQMMIVRERSVRWNPFHLIVICNLVLVPLEVWEPTNTKSSRLAGFNAKSGYFRVTLVSSRDSVK